VETIVEVHRQLLTDTPMRLIIGVGSQVADSRHIAAYVTSDGHWGFKAFSVTHTCSNLCEQHTGLTAVAMALATLPELTIGKQPLTIQAGKATEALEAIRRTRLVPTWDGSGKLEAEQYARLVPVTWQLAQTTVSLERLAGHLAGHISGGCYLPRPNWDNLTSVEATIAKHFGQ